MYKFLKISGFIIFVVALIFVILFAEGYQYDRSTGDLVKKSVIYFDMPLTAPDVSKRQLFLDDKEVQQFSFPGELRVTPGAHDVEIRREEFYPWKKRIAINENEVVWFPEIRLFPISGFHPKYLQPVSVFKISAASGKGVLLFHPYLRFGKYYNLDPDANFEIVEEVGEVSEVSELSEVSVVKAAGKMKGIWSSRVSDTFHFLLLTPERSLLFCDEDGGNCHELARLDTSFIQASEDRTIFFTILRSEFVIFDFGETPFLPRLFENLVSDAVGEELFG